LAVGYYDRCKAAMRAALGCEALTRPVLEAIGREHQVCPFELSLDVSSWVDAVICDYNYVFDPKVYLRRHFAEEARDYAFLVDEAHNLVDRAREMFSAELDGTHVQEVRRAIRKALPDCARALTRLSSAMRDLCVASALPAEEASNSDPGEDSDLFASKRPVSISPAEKSKSLPGEKALTYRELPAHLLSLLDHALKQGETWLARNEPSEFRESLLELYFKLHSFRRTAELYDERYVTLIEPNGSIRVRLFCLDPSHLLRQALERGKAAIFFSATLTPADYYRSLLGGSADDPFL